MIFRIKFIRMTRVVIIKMFNIEILKVVTNENLLLFPVKQRRFKIIFLAFIDERL